ncbi:MAG: SAM-dependent methyltransferase [Desulfovibrionaceae bacterium]
MKPYVDYYNRLAKKEHYPARSAYKLHEIDEKFSVFKNVTTILDLGASPGSWSLVAHEKTPPHCKIISCDIKELEICHEKITFFKENVFSRSNTFNMLLSSIAPFDLIMSDMAPNTTGSKVTDAAASLALCEEALWITDDFLAPHGTFITKIFMGGDIQSFHTLLKERFNKVKMYKPKSSRKKSKEIFYIAMQRKSF